MSTYKHQKKEKQKALAVKSVVVSEMNTFLSPSRKNNTGSSYEEIADKWLNLMPIKVLSKSHFTDGIKEHELKIPVSDIRKIFNYTYTQDGKRKKWFDWFHNHYPLWMTTRRGFTGHYSIGIPTFNTIETLIKIPAEKFVEAWELEHKENTDSNLKTHTVKIDTTNLHHYIEYCKRLDNNTIKFQKATERAVVVYKLALGINATETCSITGKVYHLIPQSYTTKHSGRRYYTGICALQSCSKDVRAAALGPCYEVDLSSSVYSFYKWLGVQFGIDTNILTVLLENKMKFRSELAECLTDTRADKVFKIKLIKDVMQAIGFGSDPHSVYSAVSKVIYNNEDYQRLIQHPSFIALKQIYKDIVAYAKVNPEYKQLQKQYKQDTNNVKWTSFMAYLYQSYEAIVMQDIQKTLEDREILLWVHDGIYVKHKPNLMDVQYVLSKLNPYATVELQKHDKYSASSGKIAEIEEEIQLHKHRIAQQEQIAKAKYSGNKPIETLSRLDPGLAIKHLMDQEPDQWD
tara:strand:+ start:3719 stop:5266 length:1548 start_codon:yes stop_codon:yes gene_type:complete